MALASEAPSITISGEMIETARRQEGSVTVVRTKASAIDTLSGILGEYVFAQYFYGDWKSNNVGRNKGRLDFPLVEVKTSSFPLRQNLHLPVREDYATRRKPPFYVLIILDVRNSKATSIDAGTRAYLCGWATAEEVGKAPLRDMGSKYGSRGGYRCRCVCMTDLHPMSEFRQAYELVAAGLPQAPTASRSG